MASYEDLVLATLTCGVMPSVVPQLKTITLGGAVAGVGIYWITTNLWTIGQQLPRTPLVIEFQL